MRNDSQFFVSDKNSTNQPLNDFKDHLITFKREDLLNKDISGNKFRKLKYNIAHAKEESYSGLLTFGGAFSNHLAAVATAGKRYGFKTIGIVRGEEWKEKMEQSRTLLFCKEQEMECYFVSREDYRLKEKGILVKELISGLKTIYMIPEGGTNSLAVKGCKEILTDGDANFDVVCCCVGTGGTIAGLIESAQSHQTVMGFAALKHKALATDIGQFTLKTNWILNHDYTFGGYAKVSNDLIAFMNDFYQQYEIPLDPIYTGKMVFGIFDLIKNKKWQWGKKILIIHSGGLQGIQGMNSQLQKKGYPTIHYASE